MFCRLEKGGNPTGQIYIATTDADLTSKQVDLLFEECKEAFLASAVVVATGNLTMDTIGTPDGTVLSVCWEDASEDEVKTLKDLIGGSGLAFHHVLLANIGISITTLAPPWRRIKEGEATSDENSLPKSLIEQSPPGA